MSRVPTLAEAILNLDADDLGETLRALTFTGEGIGCFSTFEVRRPASRWGRALRVALWTALDYDDPDDADRVSECADLGEGYTWKLDDLLVHVCWFWDGNGTLVFDARSGRARRLIVNTDCKKDYGWEDEPDAMERCEGEGGL